MPTYIRIPDDVEDIHELVEKKKKEYLATSSQIDSTNRLYQHTVSHADKKCQSLKQMKEHNTKEFDNNKMETTRTTFESKIDYLVANAIANI